MYPKTSEDYDFDHLSSKERLVAMDLEDLESLALKRERSGLRQCRLWDWLWSTRPVIRYTCCALALTLLVYALRSRDDSSDKRRDLLFSRLPAGSALELQGDRHIPHTAGVVPIRAHSHNDYAKPVPLWTALSFGYSSVEADVWLKDGQVMLAHYLSETKAGFTLRSAYVDPLVELLEEANGNLTNRHSTQARGVFELAPEMPLQLLIDFKTDEPELYRAVLRDLEPLRARGWLTSYNSEDGLRARQVTAIASGSAPLDLIRAETTRELFYDAPLASLAETDLDRFISPMASTNFQLIEYWISWLMPSRRRKEVCRLIKVARERGVASRFWGMPSLLSRHRKEAWREVLDCGVDWLNVDELEEGSHW